MKNFLFLALAISFASYNLPAQKKTVFHIKSGEEANHSIPYSERYNADTFSKGKIIYKNGKTAYSNLNYNMLLDEMHFLNSNGDTLSLTDEVFLREVRINDEIFLYDAKYGFLKIVDDFNFIKLAAKDYFGIVNVEKNTAYGQSSAVSSVGNYSTITSDNGVIQKLKIKGDIVLKKERRYYIVDKNTRSHNSQKSTFLKLFPNQKKGIESFLKENPVDFKNNDDLIRLISFCIAEG